MKKNLCFNVHFFNSVILLASLLLTGCYDDKGNYDYTELAPMEITLSNTYMIMSLSRWKRSTARIIMQTG